jgi:exo-1,4-beta-D-glucosaminidase
MRAMFEAFEVNKPNTTGIIQWMLNSAWPGMLWQLYDWYMMPNGAFYGAKTACRPLNIIYNYKDKNIYLSNDYYELFENLTAEIRVLDINSREVFSESLKVSIGKNESVNILEMPAMTGLTTTYFLDLRLIDNTGNLLNSNFYWLSTKDDVPDFENSEWFITPNKSYADFTGINGMAETELNVDHDFIEQEDTVMVEVRLQNTTEKIAFFIQLELSGRESGSSILPVFWEDNYVSILPGETREISGYVFRKDLEEDEPVFSYKGWNIK